MTERVLTPLGLHDSFFNTNVTRYPTAATRHDPQGKPIPYYTTATPASGELCANAHDLARFAMFNMKSHLVHESRILDDGLIGELHKPVFTGPSGVATTFGWFSARLKSGIPVIFKNGGDPGVATILYMIPSEELACLVLTNRSDGRELAERVCNPTTRQLLARMAAAGRDLRTSAFPFPGFARLRRPVARYAYEWRCEHACQAEHRIQRFRLIGTR